MHYKINKEVIIKSENAAKPYQQASTYLTHILETLPPVESSFDYGCGKLRYERALLKRTNELAIIDSEVQLSRTQRIWGRTTTIRDQIVKSNHIDAYNDKEFQACTRRFDRGFCINVLSVVPFLKIRTQILKVIHFHLKASGTCLFVVQYRNSDFTRMSQLPNARPWRDGYIIDSLRGHSFYGLIRPERLMQILKQQHFKIEDVFLNEGSAFVWASKN